jgi:hypothetical protein
MAFQEDLTANRPYLTGKKGQIAVKSGIKRMPTVSNTKRECVIYEDNAMRNKMRSTGRRNATKTQYGSMCNALKLSSS